MSRQVLQLTRTKIHTKCEPPRGPEKIPIMRLLARELLWDLGRANLKMIPDE